MFSISLIDLDHFEQIKIYLKFTFHTFSSIKCAIETATSIFIENPFNSDRIIYVQLQL